LDGAGQITVGIKGLISASLFDSRLHHLTLCPRQFGMVIVAPLIQWKHHQADFVQAPQAYDTRAERNAPVAASPQVATTHLFAFDQAPTQKQPRR
jgi:hypothetical protein